MKNVRCCKPGCKKRFELTRSTMVLAKTIGLAAMCPDCAETQKKAAEQIERAIRYEERAKKPDSAKIHSLKVRKWKLVELQSYGVRMKYEEYCEKWRAIGPQDGKLAQEFFNLLDELDDLKGKQSFKWGGRYFMVNSDLEKTAIQAVKKGQNQFQPAKVTLTELAKTCDPMIAGFTLADLKDSGSRARHLSTKAKADLAKELKDRQNGIRRPRRKPEPKVEVVVEPETATPPPLPETAGSNGGNGEDKDKTLAQQPFAVLAAKSEEASPIAPDGTPAN